MRGYIGFINVGPAPVSRANVYAFWEALIRTFSSMPWATDSNGTIDRVPPAIEGVPLFKSETTRIIAQEESKSARTKRNQVSLFLICTFPACCSALHRYTKEIFESKGYSTISARWDPGPDQVLVFAIVVGPRCRRPLSALRDPEYFFRFLHFFGINWPICPRRGSA